MNKFQRNLKQNSDILIKENALKMLSVKLWPFCPRRDECWPATHFDAEFDVHCVCRCPDISLFRHTHLHTQVGCKVSNVFV